MSEKNEKKKSPSIWVPVILVAAMSTGLNLFIFNNIKSSDTVAAEPVVVLDPQFLTVEPFTVNIMSEGHRNRLLYSGLTLSTPNAESLDVLKKHLPQVKNRLISVMSSSHADELITVEGKSKLAERILEALKDPTLISQPGLVVDEVLFTDFVVQ